MDCKNETLARFQGNGGMMLRAALHQQYSGMQSHAAKYSYCLNLSVVLGTLVLDRRLIRNWIDHHGSVSKCLIEKVFTLPSQKWGSVTEY